MKKIIGFLSLVTLTTVISCRDHDGKKDESKEIQKREIIEVPVPPPPPPPPKVIIPLPPLPPPPPPPPHPPKPPLPPKPKG